MVSQIDSDFTHAVHEFMYKGYAQLPDEDLADPRDLMNRLNHFDSMDGNEEMAKFFYQRGYADCIAAVMEDLKRKEVNDKI